MAQYFEKPSVFPEKAASWTQSMKSGSGSGLRSSASFSNLITLGAMLSSCSLKSGRWAASAISLVRSAALSTRHELAYMNVSLVQSQSTRAPFSCSNWSVTWRSGKFSVLWPENEVAKCNNSHCTPVS